MTEKIVFWQGETQLLQWSETNTRGRTITLQLNEDDEAHPFKHTAVKHGKTAGKRFIAVFVQIDDDEQPVEKTPSQLAYLWCKDPAFWAWADDRSFDTIDNEDAARAYVLTACGVKSRGDIDRNPTARATWEAVIYEPFRAHREATIGVKI
jgi:hypothetical protein